MAESLAVFKLKALKVKVFNYIKFFAKNNLISLTLLIILIANSSSS